MDASFIISDIAIYNDYKSFLKHAYVYICVIYTCVIIHITKVTCYLTHRRFSKTWDQLFWVSGLSTKFHFKKKLRCAMDVSSIITDNLIYEGVKHLHNVSCIHARNTKLDNFSNHDFIVTAMIFFWWAWFFSISMIFFKISMIFFLWFFSENS